MFKFANRFLVTVLTTATFAASAQVLDRSDDPMGQEVTQSDETLPTPVEQRMLRITNTKAGAHDETVRDAPARDRDQLGSNAARLPEGAMTERSRRKDRNEVGTRIGGAGDQDVSEFQKFMLDNTGEMLPVFGAEFFTNAGASYTPIVNSPLPADHQLGPGDELLIRGTGTIDIDYRATVDRNGMIMIPTIGTIVMAGVRAGEAESVVRNAVARLYKGVAISVTYGRLRAITIYVVGQARRPGTYTVPSLSTLVTGLFASGGPNANGSMRRVQVMRGNRTVAELDLYSFIAKGDKSADVKLQNGDSIYIPPAGGFVGLVGMVNSPAIYELKSGDTIESLLDVAGGLPVVADPRRAFLERIDPTKSQPRTIDQFALVGEDLKRTLKDGDVLNITSITPDFSNAVVLRGNVDQAVRAPFKPGMRVSDLIPNREYLISRSSIKRQNNAVMAGQAIKEIDNEFAAYDSASKRRIREGEEESTIASRIGGLIDQINWDYAVVERINRSDLTVKLIPFNLGSVFSNPAGSDNVQLQPGDTVTVFSQEDVAVPMDKRRVFARVEGEVRVPGVYQMGAGETIQSLLAKAGGPTSNAYLFGTAFYREQVRKEQQINLEKAAVRMEAQLRSEQARSIANVSAMSAAEAQAAAAQRTLEIGLAQEAISRFRQLRPTGRIAFGLDVDEKTFARLPALKLQNGDRLVVPARPEFVHVFGAVNAESSPLWRANSRVKDYLRQSGVSRDADIENVFVIRVDGTVVTRSSTGWFSTGIASIEVMPGDSIVVPEKFDKETSWTKFTKGTREWAQIFANFGLGAAAIQTLRN